MLSNVLKQKIEKIKITLIENKYKSEICGLLDEILNSSNKIKSESEIEAINFAIKYLDKEEDLFPDSLDFGLLDDYIVLKYITFKIIYKYNDSICFAAINNFLNYEQIVILMQLSNIEYKVNSDIQNALNLKIQNIKNIDTKLRTELLQIIIFLNNIILLNDEKLNKIAHWAMAYFLYEDDIINDASDYGYIDDFLILKSAEMSIKEQLYKNFPNHFELLYKYEKYFLPLYFKKDDKPVHLNDFEKMISVLFFEKAIKGEKDNFGLVLPEQSPFTKTLIYFFYQIGLLAKNYFEKNSQEEILTRLKNKKRILHHIASDEQFLFSCMDKDGYKFIEKENKQGKKSKESLDTRILPEELLFDTDKYEILPITSKGNRSNKTQHKFIIDYLSLIIANYFDCSRSEIELLDAKPEKITLSPIGRVYTLQDYNKISVNEIPLNKIFPIASIGDDGKMDKKQLKSSSQHGFINACKINYPSIARDIIINNPEEYHALFIDFSGINSYQHDYSKFINDSDSKSIDIPLYSFYNISQIAFKKIEHNDYYVVSKELAKLISFSYENNENKSNPFENLGKYKIENLYIESQLFKQLHEYSDSFPEDEDDLKRIYDLNYQLSSFVNDSQKDEIISNIKSILPKLTTEEIKKELDDHLSEYRKTLLKIFERYNTSSFSIFTTKLSTEYIQQMGLKNKNSIRIERVHKIQKLQQKEQISIIMPFYGKNIYDVLLYPRAKYIFFILDKTKKEKHEKRVQDFTKFLNLDSESILSGSKPKSIIITDFTEDLLINKIYKNLVNKINNIKYQNEKKIECCIVSFDDNTNRFLKIDSKIYLLDPEDNNLDHHGSSWKKAKDLQSGDPVIWYSSQTEDFEDSLTGIFLKNSNINNLFVNTQEWRNILRDLFTKHNNDLHRFKAYLGDNDIKVTESTLKNWLNKKYQVHLQKKEKYVPLIFKLNNSRDQDGQRCLDEINKYLRIRLSLGKKIKSFLIHDISKGESHIKDWILNFVDETGESFFSKNDDKVIQGLTTFFSNIEVLRVERIQNYEKMVPLSWNGKRLDHI